MLCKIITAVVLTGLLVPAVSFADIVSSTNFKVNTPVLKLGSGFSTSSSFRLWSAIGEGAIGLSTTTGFNIKAGFLYVPGSISVATTTEEAEPAPTTVTVITGGGGGGGYILLPRARALKGLLRADFNNDGLVDIADLSILLYHYGRRGAGIDPFDFNKDGVVDILDISILLYYWIS